MLAGAIEADIVDPRGKTSIEVLGVGLPVQRVSGEFACEVFLPGTQKPTLIFGEDSLQALCLALSVLRKSVENLSSLGWKFYYRSSTEQYCFNAYFAS